MRTARQSTRPFVHRKPLLFPHRTPCGHALRCSITRCTSLDVLRHPAEALAIPHALHLRSSSKNTPSHLTRNLSMHRGISHNNADKEHRRQPFEAMSRVEAELPAWMA